MLSNIKIYVFQLTKTRKIHIGDVFLNFSLLKKILFKLNGTFGERNHLRAQFGAFIKNCEILNTR